MGAVHKPRVLTYHWTKNGGQVNRGTSPEIAIRRGENRKGAS
jgi:hypothetical protein